MLGTWARSCLAFRAACGTGVSPAPDGEGACSLRTIGKSGPSPGSAGTGFPLQRGGWVWRLTSGPGTVVEPSRLPAEDGALWQCGQQSGLGVCPAVLLQSCPPKEQTPLAPSLRASSGKLPWPLLPSTSTPPVNKGVPSLRALVVSGTLLLFLFTSECRS